MQTAPRYPWTRTSWFPAGFLVRCSGGFVLAGAGPSPTVTAVPRAVWHGTPCPALSPGCVPHSTEPCTAVGPGGSCPRFPGWMAPGDVLPSPGVRTMQKGRERLLTSPHEILDPQFLLAKGAAGSTGSAGGSPAAPGAPTPAAPSTASHCSGINGLRGHHRGQEQLESCEGEQGFISPPFPDALCPFPHIQHGKRVPAAHNSYRIGDTVSFVCNAGYTLQGSRTSTCRADFRWSPPLPQCKKGKCPSAR